MPLVLDLIRHGDALPSERGDDASRRLSPRGIALLERLARHFAPLGFRPTRVFSSPLLRAIESARIVLPPSSGIAVEELDALLPDAEPEEVADALAAADATRGHVLIVGHQPLLGDFAGWLAGGPAHPFAPGAWVRLEFEDALEPGGATIGMRLRPDEIA